MENFEDLYEEWIDQINSSPLVTDRINEFDEVINLNQQIVNNIYNIRRYLELRDLQQSNHSPRSRYTRSSFYSNGPYESTFVTPTVSPFISSTTDIINDFFNEQFNGGEFLNNLFNMAFNETNDYEDVKVTLTEDEFDKFLSEEITNEKISDYNEKECNICMDSYQLNDTVTHLKCKHIFHKDCIKNWLCNEKISCPVCRKDTRDLSV